MPDHNITVIDLGLNIQDAIDMQLQCETFTRKKKMAKDLDFNAIEHEYFDGKLQYNLYGTKKSWIYRRVELNAMSAGQLVDYIDQGISRAIKAQSLDKKVIPPEEVLNDKAVELLQNDLNEKMDVFIQEKLKIDDLKAELFKIISGKAGAFGNQRLKPGVDEYLADNELDTWKDSIQAVVDDKLDDLNTEVEIRIKELVSAAIMAA